jgi:Ice-binding-like
MNTFKTSPRQLVWSATLLLSAMAGGCGGGGDGRDPILGAGGVGIAGGAGQIAGAQPTTTPATFATLLGSAARFGIFGGSAGMTNTGNQTVITGSGNTADIGTTATGTSSITGFHDSSGDIYTEAPGVNVGNVTGNIFTCTNSTTGPTSAGVNAASCTTATNARAAALTAYNTLVAQPAGPNPGAGNLANLTLAPGVFTAAAGSFKIEGGNLTLDAKGDPNAVWVFQMATTLTVGGPGAAAPQSIILAGGAQAKNVYWQVGSAATINAGGGGTMVGTIISQAGVTFSTAGNTAPSTLNGRALSLGASVTMVNTAITVPAP